MAPPPLEHTTGQAAAKMAVELAPAGRPPSVLLAEEDEAMREVLGAALRAAGYETLEISTAGELLHFVDAAQRCEQDHPAIDAVVCDVALPGHTRQTLLARVRALAPGLPLVAVCSFGDEHAHAEFFKLGADAVLDKPFDVEALVLVLQILAPPPQRRIA